MSGLLAYWVVLAATAVAFSAEPNPEKFAVVGTDRFAESAYPTVASLSDGQLLCVFSATDARTGDKAVIAGSFSDDQGRTWSDPAVLIDSRPDLDYDPAIVVVESRVIVTSTSVPSTHGQFISTSRTVAVRSDDNGQSWSPPYEIPMGHRYTAGKIHAGIMLRDGTVLFGYAWDAALEKPKQRIQSEGQQECHSAVMISRDRGQTWQSGADAHLVQRRPGNRASAVNGLDEPAIVQCRDGSVLMLCRTGLDRLYQCRSTDGGRTWKEIEASPLVSHNAPAALCRVNGLHPGLLAVWNYSPKDRWPLCAALSLDEGKTWGPPRELACRPGFQSSYPGCTQASDGKLVVVWQQQLPDGKREIVGARFDVEWLRDAPAPAAGESSPPAAGSRGAPHPDPAAGGEPGHED